MRPLHVLLTVLWVTLKRIAHNARLAGALFAGLALAAGIMATIPIYTAASLQRSFLLRWAEQGKGRSAFTLILAHDNDRRRFIVGADRLDALASTFQLEMPRVVGQTPVNHAVFASLGGDPFLRVGDGPPDLLTHRMDLASMSNLHDVAQVTQGRWYEPREDGVLEAVVDQTVLDKSELEVGGRYVVWYELTVGESEARGGAEYERIPVEVVGVFESRPGKTAREWIYPPPFFGRAFVDPEVFRARLMGELGLRAGALHLQWVFDHNRVRVDALGSLIEGLESAEARAERMVPSTKLWWSPLDFFREFHGIQRGIRLFLLSLASPALGLVLLYVVLMAGLSVEHRRTEVAVLQSRGGGRLQVLASFLLEWLVLAVVAAAAGPFLGRLITAVVGSVSGFLSFVDRRPLPAVISPVSLAYAALAALTAVAASVAGVSSTLRHSIVTLRQAQARSPRRSVWHGLYLDLVCLGLAVFGHRALTWQGFSLTPGAELEADPILFLVPVVGVLGGGLLLLRLYPLIMGLAGHLAARVRGVVWQLTFRRLARASAHAVPLLLFLALTSAMGIYSAAAARTISRNLQDRVRYQVGADLVTRERWSPPSAGGPAFPGETAFRESPGSLTEPPFLSRTDIPGIAEAARVVSGTVSLEHGSRVLGQAALLAMEPHEFARTAWYRDNLFEARFFDYLSLLARHPSGILVSGPLQRAYGLNVGDALLLTYKGQTVDVMVAGTVEYWPSLDPTRRPFVVMSLGHLHENTALEPYDVWYRLTDDADVQAIVDNLADLGVWVTEIRDTRARLVELLREPYRMGFFGILSIGFLVSIVVTILGFLIFTYYSVRGRVVQFAALRANGLSLAQLLAVVGLEQVAHLGLGMGLGAGLGTVSAALFLPFLRDRADGLGGVPPFLVVRGLGDLSGFFLAVAGLFVVVVLGLSIYLARSRLFEALKMGGDG